MGKRLASKRLFFLFDQSLVFSIIRTFCLKKKKKKVNFQDIYFHPDNWEFLGFCTKALLDESEIYKAKILKMSENKNTNS